MDVYHTFFSQWKVFIIKVNFVCLEKWPRGFYPSSLFKIYRIQNSFLISIKWKTFILNFRKYESERWEMGDENLYFKNSAEIFFFLVLRWQILSPTFVCSEFSLFFTFSEWKGKDLAFWFYSKWETLRIDSRSTMTSKFQMHLPKKLQ